MPGDTKIINATNVINGYTIVRVADLASSTAIGESASKTGTHSSTTATEPNSPKKVVAVGVGVGVGVGVPLLAALLGALVLLWRERARTASAGANIPAVKGYEKITKGEDEAVARQPDPNPHKLNVQELGANHLVEKEGTGNGIENIK